MINFFRFVIILSDYETAYDVNMERLNCEIRYYLNYLYKNSTGMDISSSDNQFLKSIIDSTFDSFKDKESNNLVWDSGWLYRDLNISVELEVYLHIT